MSISLDVLLYLGRIVLIGAGCAALIYLAIVFKNLSDTLKAATATLDIVQRDLQKLESPLQTVDDLSNTVDELHVSAKKAANSALSTFTAGMDSLKDKFTGHAGETSAPDVVIVEEPQSDFRTITEAEAADPASFKSVDKGEENHE